ncbi:bile acid:sodium symporter family protein [Nocardioides sp. YIM 152315]|uniref:bile acid:sodium symporter family protein n=1 Tax=Nocardioides sp. YIM 152315 TaxID=3031760 RepID=UPI0023DC36A4|nr:bile acid:sodium symporter family protein [Nocardioides sp. YIM 152315]MDF1605668.1 bile acid:sodium symporter family protein [Nocardioides sp. YIM 152315]
MTAYVAALATDIDRLQLEISDGLQFGVKAIVALFLFGIALDTRIDDFRDVVRRPWVIVVGLVAQYVVTPGLTVLLTLVLDVRGSVAIGMILVVCCPAGNLSNLLTHRARGDVALSVSLTTVSTVTAVAVTPVAVAFWCGLNPAAEALLRDVQIDPWDMVGEAVLLIALPFALGILIAWLRPAVSARARKVVEPAALVLLVLIIVGALAGQFGLFLDYVGVVAVAIVLQNALSLVVGYGSGRATRLPEPGVRAMTLEVGLRNTGLALVLALAFFEDLGGVAFVAAMWGLWDTVTGLVLSTWWRRRPAGAGVSTGPTTDADLRPNSSTAL